MCVQLQVLWYCACGVVSAWCSVLVLCVIYAIDVQVKGKLISINTVGMQAFIFH